MARRKTTVPKKLTRLILAGPVAVVMDRPLLAAAYDLPVPIWLDVQKQIQPTDGLYLLRMTEESFSLELYDKA